MVFNSEIDTRLNVAQNICLGFTVFFPIINAQLESRIFSDSLEGSISIGLVM